MTLNFTPFPNLATERLLFRQLMNEDEDAIFKLRSDERVNKYIGRNPPKTVIEVRAFIDKINRNITNNESMYWAITLKNNNKLIGTICLWNFQLEKYKAEIGYELNPDYWGQGIMKEAIPRIIEYAFTTLKLHSLEGDSHPENTPSAVLLERNGFVKEEEFPDRLIYVLTNPQNQE